MKTSLWMFLAMTLLTVAPAAHGQAQMTWASGDCYANYTFISSPGPIGCYAYCGCTNEIDEWNLTLLASAGWDCTIDVATGTVVASADGSGLSGNASIAPSSFNPLDGGSSLLSVPYFNSCDGFAIDLGLTAYTDQC